MNDNTYVYVHIHTFIIHMFLLYLVSYELYTRVRTKENLPLVRTKGHLCACTRISKTPRVVAHVDAYERDAGETQKMVFGANT